ncbi:hypothetical protein SAMN00790413_06301 [Deinococcus hopiensis KR-140]|uniref:Uncharacterized protein n=1 Tax=Deinococcus hopiensis KR-140 TaxID=695939 RepID=A0A1W1VUJ4_9DEIO|nr:hypothetical protein SAMN00790413_06301 [Deinococcus hopiensis KR-140]
MNLLGNPTGVVRAEIAAPSPGLARLTLAAGLAECTHALRNLLHLW